MATASWLVAPYVLLVLLPAVPAATKQAEFMLVHGASSTAILLIAIASVAALLALATIVTSVIRLLPDRTSDLVLSVLTGVVWGTFWITSRALSAVPFLPSDSSGAPSLLLVASSAMGVALGAAVIARRHRLGEVLVAFGVIALGVSTLFAQESLLKPGAPSLGDPDPSVNRPSVLLVIADELQYSAAFDDEGKVRDFLPNLASLQADSTTYTRAYTSGARTTVAVPAILSGLDVGGNPQKLLGVTLSGGILSEALKVMPILALSSVFEQPFNVLTSKNPALPLRDSSVERLVGLAADLSAVVGRIALADWVADLFLPEVTGQWRDFWRPDAAPADDDVAQVKEAALSSQGQPVFVFWHSMQTHNPWTVDFEGREIYQRSFISPADTPGESSRNGPPSEPIRSLQGRLYLASAMEFDRQLGEVLDAWKASGRFENSLIVITSDHGRVLGLRVTGARPEDGVARSGFDDTSFWGDVAHVPLLVKGPYQNMAETVTEVRSTGQVASTIARMVALPSVVVDPLPDLDSSPPQDLGVRIGWSDVEDETRLLSTAVVSSSWTEEDFVAADISNPFLVGVEPGQYGTQPAVEWMRKDSGEARIEVSAGTSPFRLARIESTGLRCPSAETALLTDSAGLVRATVSWEDAIHEDGRQVGWGIVPSEHSDDLAVWCRW